MNKNNNITAEEALAITEKASLLESASAAIRYAAEHARGSVRFDLTQKDIESLEKRGFKVNPIFKMSNGTYRSIISWREED